MATRILIDQMRVFSDMDTAARRFNYRAVFDGYEDSQTLIGWGRTPKEAAEDLLRQSECGICGRPCQPWENGLHKACVDLEHFELAQAPVNDPDEE
jgi:hypothetical protein